MLNEAFNFYDVILQIILSDEVHSLEGFFLLVHIVMVIDLQSQEDPDHHQDNLVDGVEYNLQNSFLLLFIGGYV